MQPRLAGRLPSPTLTRFGLAAHNRSPHLSRPFSLMIEYAFLRANACGKQSHLRRDKNWRVTWNDARTSSLSTIREFHYMRSHGCNSTLPNRVEERCRWRRERWWAYLGKEKKEDENIVGNNRPVLRSLELLRLRMCQPCREHRWEKPRARWIVIMRNAEIAKTRSLN